MGKVWWYLLPRTWETEAEDIESRSTWAIQQDHLVSKKPNKQTNKRGSRDGSSVKSTRYSSRILVQFPESSQLFMSPFLGDLMHFLASEGTRCTNSTDIHVGKAPIHIKKNFFKKKEYRRTSPNPSKP